MFAPRFMHRTGVILATVAVLLPLAAVAQQSTPPHTLPPALFDVAAAAYRHSPVIRAARQQLRQVQELYPQALANYQPDVTASAGITDEQLDNSNFAGADGATTKDIGVTLDQPLWRGGRSRAQKNESKARIRAQTAALQATEQRIMADAMRAAVTAHAAARKQAVQTSAESLYRRLLGDTVKRQEGGEATQTDRALAQSQLDGATAARIAADDSRAAASRALIAHTGRSAAEWRLEDAAHGSVVPLIAAGLLPDSIDSAATLARAHNSDRAVLVSIHDAENHGIELARGELLPELHARASWQREWDPSPGLIDEATSRVVGLRLTVPLYEGGGTRARVRAAKSRLIESGYELEDFDLQLARDVGDAFSAAQAAAARADALASQSAAAQQARDNIAQEIMAGEKTMTDLVQADQTWLGAQLAAIDADSDALLSQIELLRLTGRLTPQAMGFGSDAYDTQAYLTAVQHQVLSTSLPD